jgi:hypothetical protein
VARIPYPGLAKASPEVREMLGRLQFVRGIVQDAAGSGGQLAAVREFLSERETVELIIMVGFYTMLARLTEALGIELDPPIGSALVRGIEQRVAASARASEA